jgi:hypothetical protein
VSSTGTIVGIVVGVLTVVSLLCTGLVWLGRGIWRMSARATELNQAVRKNTEATSELADQFRASSADVTAMLTQHEATLVAHEGRITRLETTN